jgi:hypothetical protein
MAEHQQLASHFPTVPQLSGRAIYGSEFRSSQCRLKRDRRSRCKVIAVSDIHTRIDRVEYTDCNESLDHSYASPAKGICPRCGSLKRTIHIDVLTETLELHEKAKWRSRDSRRGKPLRWGVIGDDLHGRSGRWSLLERIFDRIKGVYYEHISDKESGAVIKHCEERLSDHRGHGSAKIASDKQARSQKGDHGK